MSDFSFSELFITGDFGGFRGRDVGGRCESSGMTDAAETLDGEAYLAAIEGIVADVEEIGVEFARVKIRELRALAAAGRLADAQGGRLRPVYEALGISRKTLYDKMQRHGLDRRLTIDPEEEDPA